MMRIPIFLVNNKDLVDLHTSIHRSVAVKPAFLHRSLDANPSHRINDEAWRPPRDVRVGRSWKLTFLLLFLISLILNISITYLPNVQFEASNSYMRNSSNLCSG